MSGRLIPPRYFGQRPFACQSCGASRTSDPRFTLASSLALRKLWAASQALRLLAITNPMPPRITSEDAVRRTVIPSPSTKAPPSAVIAGTLNCTDAPCVGVRPGIAAYQIV